VNLLKNLSHPNIVVSAVLLSIELHKVEYKIPDCAFFSFSQRYLGTAREVGSLNILLEFVPGGSISSLLGKFGSFPESVSADCLCLLFELQKGTYWYICFSGFIFKKHSFHLAVTSSNRNE